MHRVAGMLDRFIADPRLVEIDHADIAAPAERVYEVARRFDIGSLPVARGLFSLRTLPDRVSGKTTGPPALTYDEIDRQGTGFRILVDEPPRAFAMGAIGRFWELSIPFVPFEPQDFAAYRDPGVAKVAWEIRVEPLGAQTSRIVFELRLTATDDESWKKVRRYFRVIGPFSHFIRRHMLATLARELGTPESVEQTRALPGDELLPDAKASATRGITIEASPEAIWPWLVQMGCRRGGWYSYDLLDNAGVESAREIRPELQDVRVGQILPATPKGGDGFEVLRIDSPRALILGGLYDLETNQQLPFDAPEPARSWRVTWAFVLEPRGGATRLTVRARLDYRPAIVRLRALGMAPVHHFMQRRQLINLKERAEHRPHDSWKDVAEGVTGAAAMIVDLATPFLRESRSHWGIDEETARRSYPGDELVAGPRWSWTHGIEIDAPAEEVWPWIAQIGQGRAGFYSYQWLENLAGCGIENAERVHPEWPVPKPGDTLRLHPELAMTIAAVEEGRWLVAHAPIPPEDPVDDISDGASWLFYVEPLPGGRSRFISRYRTRYPDTLADRLRYGPIFTESVGFVMDRRMLLGVKQRVERHHRAA